MSTVLESGQSTEFAISPCVFLIRDFERSDTPQTITSGCPLGSWSLKYHPEKKFGIIPISEAIPPPYIRRPSNRVRVTGVRVSFGGDRTPRVRFRCHVFRHPGRVGQALSMKSRPHVNSTSYLRLRDPIPVRSVLFDMLDASRVAEDCGGSFSGSSDATNVSLSVPNGLGRVFVKEKQDDPRFVGNKFEEELELPDLSRRYPDVEINIELNEIVEFSSSWAPESVDGRPLELFVGIESGGIGGIGSYISSPVVELPIYVKVFFESIL